MPGPATIFSIGAVGAGAAAVYANRRYSQSSSSDDSLTPIQLARRRSSTVQPDHDWVKRKQPEYIWRRDNGVSFSHNSKPKFPTAQTEQSSSTK